MNATIVCVGPSLSASEIQSVLPNSVQHPPVEAGDILRLMRLKPERILLIDGRYENTPAVWHKEIIWAMQQGVSCIGASSMGALRAAELETFGMIGIGAIFQQYQQGRIDNDAAVALLHLDAEHDYQCQTEALVNIHATIEKAISQKKISKQTATAALEKSRQQFYQERQFSHFCQHNGFSHDEQTWLQKHRVDQKRLDALEALAWIAQHPAEPPKITEPLQHSYYLYRLMYRKNAECFPTTLSWLPKEEKKLSHTFSRLAKGAQILLHECAYLLQIAQQFVKAPDVRSLIDTVTTQPLEVSSDRYAQFARIHNFAFEQQWRERPSPDLCRFYTQLWLFLSEQEALKTRVTTPMQPGAYENMLWGPLAIAKEADRATLRTALSLKKSDLREWGKRAYQHHIFYKTMAGQGLIDSPSLTAENWLLRLSQFFYTC